MKRIIVCWILLFGPMRFTKISFSCVSCDDFACAVFTIRSRICCTGDVQDFCVCRRSTNLFRAGFARCARELPLTKVKGYEPIAVYECTKREEIKEMFQHSHNKKKGCRSRL